MVFIVRAVRAGEAVVAQDVAKLVKGVGNNSGVGFGWPWHKEGGVGGDAGVDSSGDGGRRQSGAEGAGSRCLELCAG